MLETYKTALEKNNFGVFIVKDEYEACQLFFNELFPSISPLSVSCGDSETLLATGILDILKNMPDINYIDALDHSISKKELIGRRKEALTVDLFLTGSNAVTAKGQIVNLDMIGNRIGGIIFGPKNVILFVGKNKLSASLEDAMNRVRNIAAPANVIRHEGMKNPCRYTGKCMDCSSPQRICNCWSIVEKSYPQGRITVVLIDKELGL